MVRDLRGVWSPDGQSILVVTSAYLTTNPAEPYFAAASGHSFELVLSTYGSLNDFRSGRRTEIDRFDEGGMDSGSLSQGGIPEYEPVFWYPDLQMAVFGGRYPYTRLIDSGNFVRYEKPVAALTSAMTSHPVLQYFASVATLVDGMEIVDAIPSPDGSILAVHYAAWIFSAPGDFFSPFAYAHAVAFHTTSDGSLLAVRAAFRNDSPLDVWRSPSAMEAYVPLESDAMSFSGMVWKQDGSAVLLYLGSGQDGSSGGIDVPAAILQIPLGNSQATTAELVPDRPIPTASGPVSPGGIAFVMSVDGNATVLDTTTFPDAGVATPAWVAFFEQTWADAVEWLGRWTEAGSNPYNLIM